MTSAIGGLGGFDFQRASVLAGIQQQFNQRVAEKMAVSNSDYAAKINNVNRDTDKWEDFQGELGDAKKIVKGAVGRLESMMSLVDNLIQTVNKARLDPEIDTTQEGYRSTFDSYLKSI